jgi:hypothetical protein
MGLLEDIYAKKQNRFDLDQTRDRMASSADSLNAVTARRDISRLAFVPSRRVQRRGLPRQIAMQDQPLRQRNRPPREFDFQRL